MRGVLNNKNTVTNYLDSLLASGARFSEKLAVVSEIRPGKASQSHAKE
jgi:hypothetical protein